MKTLRDAQGGLTRRRYFAKDRPTSTGRGKQSWWPPLPRRISSPASQSISSRVRCTISPARKPSRANRSRIARSRCPASVCRSHFFNKSSTSCGDKNLSNPAWLQFATVGTAFARFVAMSPRWCRKRSKLRRATVISGAVWGLTVLARRSMHWEISCSFSSPKQSAPFPKRSKRNRRARKR